MEQSYKNPFEEKLFAAIADDDLKEAQKILDLGTDPNALDSHDRPPLVLAAREGSVEVVKELISRGADPNVRNEYGYTPLHAGVENKTVAVLEVLLASGATPTMQQSKIHGHKPIYIDTPLMCAMRKDDITRVQLLLTHGADPKECEDYGNSPLRIAVNMDNEEMVKLLLAYGADPALEIDRYGRDGESVYRISGPLVHDAIVDSSVNMIELLLICASVLETRDFLGDTPLHIAALCGRVEMVEVLLDHKASMEVRNELGETPLHHAAHNFGQNDDFTRNNDDGLLHVAELLLDRGSHLELQDEDGNTPLHRAVKESSSDMVELLLARGADPKVFNKRRMTPLMVAEKAKSDGSISDNSPVLKVLRDAVSRLSVSPETGM